MECSRRTPGFVPCGACPSQERHTANEGGWKAVYRRNFVEQEAVTKNCCGLDHVTEEVARRFDISAGSASLFLRERYRKRTCHRFWSPRLRGGSSSAKGAFKCRSFGKLSSSRWDDEESHH